MKIRLEYKTTVSVVVDTDTDEILRVVVDDECPTDFPIEAWSYSDENGDMQRMALDDDVLAAQRVVSDGNIDWPSWEFSW